jgi:hypothetical protein
MRADCELACDAAVVEHVGAIQATQYGRTLLTLAESMQHSRSVAGALGIIEVRSELGRRIMMISKHGNRPWRNAAVGGGIMAVLLAMNFTSAKDEKQTTNTYHGSMRPPVEFKKAMESLLRPMTSARNSPSHDSVKSPIEIKKEMESALLSMASASSSLSNEDNKSTQAFTLTVDPELGQLVYTFDEKTKQLESIHATTGVKFIYKGIEINADTLDYKLADKKVTANGPGMVMWMTAADHPDAPKVVSEDVTKYTADSVTLDTSTGQIDLQGNAAMEKQGPLGGLEKTNSPGTITIYLNQPISMP